MSELGVFIELYVDDLAESIEMLSDLVDVKVLREERYFAELACGTSRILLNGQSLEDFDEANPIRSAAGSARGLRVEICIAVHDIEASFETASAESRWQVASQLRQRPCGLTDFRVVHPDGFYLRITTAKSEEQVD